MNESHGRILMRLKYLTSAAVAELRASVRDDLPRYASNRPFLESFFKGSGRYLVDSRLEVPKLPDLKLSTSSDDFDEENAIRLDSALRALTPSQAADERLWVWLTHGPYWEYMRRRWPDEWKGKNLSNDEVKKGTSYILEHFFRSDARALVRNGIARLWWFGKATFDEKSLDPYHRTGLMLRTADSRQSIMERQYWRNPQVLAALLDRVEYWEKRKFTFYEPRGTISEVV